MVEWLENAEEGEKWWSKQDARARRSGSVGNFNEVRICHLGWVVRPRFSAELPESHCRHLSRSWLGVREPLRKDHLDQFTFWRVDGLDVISFIVQNRMKRMKTNRRSSECCKVHKDRCTEMLTNLNAVGKPQKDRGKTKVQWIENWQKSSHGKSLSKQWTLQLLTGDYYMLSVTYSNSFPIPSVFYECCRCCSWRQIVSWVYPVEVSAVQLFRAFSSTQHAHIGKSHVCW